MNIRTAASLGVEFWKLIRSYERASVQLDQSQQQKAQAQIRYSGSRLSALMNDFEIELVAYDGRPFDANLPVSAVNDDEFPDTGGLVIDSTIEPTAIHKGSIVLPGKVTIKKDS